MICSKCGTNNLIKADYCSSCGHAFTEQEKAGAYRETIYGKLDRLEEAQSWLTLKKITGNLFFRIAVLALIALAGILSHTNQGTKMKLLESEEYAIDWNRERNEYYLYSDLDEIRLKLYLPGTPEVLSVTALDDEGNEMHTETYSVGEEPVLLKDTPFYRITGVYENVEAQILAGVYDTELRDRN
ncbi:MAG: zinc ribbon domain-containing protein [Solobacterium sp.]|nr:zinc ribbon domain-containing protein [Solobacterium sp.]